MLQKRVKKLHQLPQPLINANKGLLYTLLNEPVTFLGGLLFFLMLFSPGYNVVFKVILIVLVLGTIMLSRVAFNRLNITMPVLKWYSLLLLHGIFFTILGFINKNNSAFILRSSTYNIVWPFFYLLFTIGLYKISSLKFLVKVIVIGNLFISLYIIGAALTLFGILPALPLVKFDMSQISFDTLGGLVKIEVPSIICLLFTVPFVVALNLLTKYKSFGFSRAFLNISIIISIVAVLVTARRALILNILLAVFFSIILAKITPALNQKDFNKRIIRLLIFGTAIIFGALVIAQEFGLFDFSLIYTKFLSGFATQGNVSDGSTITRYNQLHLLLRSWSQKPLLGYGNGAVSQYVIRSKDRPWVYELTYVALLFQTGLTGAVIYISLIFWPVLKGVQLLRTSEAESHLLLIPAIIGSACFLIANGTNPYLISYDYMWALFFPVAIINFYMKKQPGINKNHAPTVD